VVSAGIVLVALPAAPAVAAPPPTAPPPAATGPARYVTDVVRVGPTLRGPASWYGPGFEGRPTASGERYDPRQLTAAHKTLPLGTHLRVCRTGRCVVVRVNDRGPYVGTRFLDLSRRAASRIGLTGPGVADVTATVVELRRRPARAAAPVRRTPVRAMRAAPRPAAAPARPAVVPPTASIAARPVGATAARRDATGADLLPGAAALLLAVMAGAVSRRARTPAAR
jgi:rare lipoprotein A